MSPQIWDHHLRLPVVLVLAHTGPGTTWGRTRFPSPCQTRHMSAANKDASRRMPQESSGYQNAGARIAHWRDQRQYTWRARRTATNVVLGERLQVTRHGQSKRNRTVMGVCVCVCVWCACGVRVVFVSVSVDPRITKRQERASVRERVKESRKIDSNK